MKTFAAEEAGQDLFLEENPELHAARAAEAAVIGELHRVDRAGIRRRECRVRLAARAAMREERREKTLARDHALAGRKQLVHKGRALARVRRIAEHGFELHVGALVHERAGFGDDAFTGIKLDLDELHVVADDAVVDFIGALAFCERRWHARWRHARAG